MFDFQKLEVYNKAKDFHRNSLKIITSQKLNRIVNDQLFRASFSIVLNIAEGSGRFSKADRRNFFIIARSSVFECVAILDVLKDENVVTLEEFQIYQSQADELSRMLFSMIKNLS
jgi:four helix bundle protein